MRKAMSPLTRAMDDEAAKSGGMGVVAPAVEDEEPGDDNDPDTDLENAG